MTTMFNPNYHITPNILKDIKQIGILIGEFNSTNLNLFVENKLKFNSRSHSVHASISIEGNPLNLTEIRSLLKNSSKNLKDTQKEVVNYNNALDLVFNTIGAILAFLVLNIKKKVKRR